MRVRVCVYVKSSVFPYALRVVQMNIYIRQPCIELWVGKRIERQRSQTDECYLLQKSLPASLHLQLRQCAAGAASALEVGPEPWGQGGDRRGPHLDLVCHQHHTPYTCTIVTRCLCLFVLRVEHHTPYARTNVTRRSPL